MFICALHFRSGYIELPNISSSVLIDPNYKHVAIRHLFDAIVAEKYLGTYHLPKLHDLVQRVMERKNSE